MLSTSRPAVRVGIIGRGASADRRQRRHSLPADRRTRGWRRVEPDCPSGSRLDMFAHKPTIVKRLVVLLAAVAATTAVLTATAGGDRQPARHRRSRSAPELLTNPNVCIAGTGGAEGWCGDGNRATKAKLFQPQGVGRCLTVGSWSLTPATTSSARSIRPE
jgi:hypothetical protein